MGRDEFTVAILLNVNQMHLRMLANFLSLTPEQVVENAWENDKEVEELAVDVGKCWHEQVH